MHRYLVRAVLPLVLLLCVAAAHAGDEAIDQAEVAVTIASFAYSPEELRVPLGTTVIWTNTDSASHDVVSEDRFSIISPYLGRGESYAQRFEQPGSFAYFCSLHPSMQALLIVELPVQQRSELYLPMLSGDGGGSGGA
jgi:plastocyanin